MADHDQSNDRRKNKTDPRVGERRRKTDRRNPLNRNDRRKDREWADYAATQAADSEFWKWQGRRKPNSDRRKMDRRIPGSDPRVRARDRRGDPTLAPKPAPPREKRGGGTTTTRPQPRFRLGPDQVNEVSVTKQGYRPPVGAPPERPSPVVPPKPTQPPPAPPQESSTAKGKKPEDDTKITDVAGIRSATRVAKDLTQRGKDLFSKGTKGFKDLFEDPRKKWSAHEVYEMLVHLIFLFQKIFFFKVFPDFFYRLFGSIKNYGQFQIIYGNGDPSESVTPMD